jgi:ABC-type antimicrobial peptide transport system ATPase subunit
MNRKIIIKSDDFDKEIFSFVKAVGADVPLDWNIEALDWIKNAVIETFWKMGVTLEIDDRLQSFPHHLTEGEGEMGMHH